LTNGVKTSDPKLCATNPSWQAGSKTPACPPSMQNQRFRFF
jgi:hypothetical protein